MFLDGKTEATHVGLLRERFEEQVEHTVSLYSYGDPEIKKGIVAVAAGGGLDVDVLTEVAKEGVNTFVTGIGIKNEISGKAHELAEKHGINVLAGTHYSTEKFACMAMCGYFRRFGLPVEFIKDDPLLEDL
ncbi:Nif3-like dinuclear metal center hexameric protein [Nanoarchaeota archaeon]